MKILEKIFHVEAMGSTVKTECLAGLTTFIAMSYIIFVVPAMLSDGGMPREAAATATIWVAITGTLLMGLWAKFPVGVAPGLGITAYFAYTICGPAGYSWQTALGAVFVSGIVFFILTVTRLRQMIIDSVPRDLKLSIVVGIGVFITVIGMRNTGIIVADPSTFLTLGDLTDTKVLLGIGGFFLTAILMGLRIHGAMIIGIICVTIASVLLGITQVPEGDLFVWSIPLPRETFMQLDLAGALSHGLFTIIFTLTMVDLFDNMGVLIALSHKAGFINKDGTISHLGKALMADSVSTMNNAVIGGPTAICYLESAAGIAEGGRTGLTAIVVGLLFFVTFFFIPLLGMVPVFATGPALVLVGAIMLQDMQRINFRDITVAVPCFLTIVTMPMTFNIATGVGFGFISWVIVKFGTGKFKDVNPVMLVVAACFAISFAMR